MRRYEWLVKGLMYLGAFAVLWPIAQWGEQWGYVATFFLLWAVMWVVIEKWSAKMWMPAKEAIHEWKSPMIAREQAEERIRKTREEFLINTFVGFGYGLVLMKTQVVVSINRWPGWILIVTLAIVMAVYGVNMSRVIRAYRLYDEIRSRS